MTISKRQEIVGLLTSVLVTLLVAACSLGQSASEESMLSKTGNSPTNAETQESDPATSSEDGLLELELIGYVNAVESFNCSSVDELRTMIDNKENFFLYVGRPTCEWCRKVAPSLQSAFTELGVDLYYLDSTNTESDSDIQSFRESFEITEVPALLKFEQGYAKKLEINLLSDDMNDEIISLVEKEL